MDQFIITGGTRLRGAVTVSGGKNATLPIMAACLMAEGESTIRGVPDLADVDTLAGVLKTLGVEVRREGEDLKVRVANEGDSHADYDLVRKMRASVCVLGPLVGKRRYARVAMPGGCSFGPRPIDIHLRGLEALGARIDLQEGDVIAEAPDGLTGADIFLGGPFGSSVTGTANVMMAAALAKGRTIIECAACEPEIVDLADFLNDMGAKIAGAGTPRLTIDGVAGLSATEHRVIPDRIEAGTFMVAAVLTNGEITLSNTRADHLMAVTDKLRQIGAIIETDGIDLVIAANRHIHAVDVTTQPYPGFPTDLQAQLTTLLCLADGNSIIVEKIYPDRFMHIAELGRMGARIRKEGNTAIISGAKRLIGAPVMASDLRASAALVLAGIAAEGVTRVSRVYHIDRGYERIEQKLNALGADIRRESV